MVHCWKYRSVCFISPVVLDSVFHLWEVTDPEIIEFTGKDVYEFTDLWNRSFEGNLLLYVKWVSLFYVIKENKKCLYRKLEYRPMKSES